MSTKAVRSEIHERSLDHAKKYVLNELGVLVEEENAIDKQEFVDSTTQNDIKKIFDNSHVENQQIEKNDSNNSKNVMKNALVSSMKKKEEKKKK